MTGKRGGGAGGGGGPGRAPGAAVSLHDLAGPAPGPLAPPPLPCRGAGQDPCAGGHFFQFSTSRLSTKYSMPEYRVVAAMTATQTQSRYLK